MNSKVPEYYKTEHSGKNKIYFHDLFLNKNKKAELENQAPPINCFVKIIYLNKISKSYFWYCVLIS